MITTALRTALGRGRAWVEYSALALAPVFPGWLARLSRVPVRPPRSVLILPSDTKWVAGALGDEAMLTATLQRLRNCSGITRVGLIARSSRLPPRLRDAGVEVVDAAGGIASPWRLLRALQDYDAMIVVGADIMDGHYSDIGTRRALAYASLGALAGRPSVILGFSFNDHPTDAAVQGFRALHPDVRVNVRDPISLTRFETRTGRTAALVADVAFLLEPAPRDSLPEALRHWLAAQRTAGRRVVGVNLHGTLIRGDSGGEAELVAAAVETIQWLVDHDYGVLLVPHDDRPRVGDLEILRVIWRALTPEDPDRAHSSTVYFSETLLGAAQVKQLVGDLDFVVTGRMHLAIASLGRGTPVLGVTYQGKFSGLMRHFGLGDEWLVSGEEARAGGVLLGRTRDALAQADAARASVRERLPHIRRLAERNLETLTVSPTDERDSVIEPTARIEAK